MADGDEPADQTHRRPDLGDRPNSSPPARADGGVGVVQVTFSRSPGRLGSGGREEEASHTYVEKQSVFSSKNRWWPLKNEGVRQYFFYNSSNF